MDRLELLYEADMMDEEVLSFTKKIREFLFLTYTIQEEVTEMMLTHLALATQRVKNSQAIEEIEETVYDHILEDECYEHAQEILQIIMDSSMVVYPKSEQHYLVLHICNILHTVNQ